MFNYLGYIAAVAALLLLPWAVMILAKIAGFGFRAGVDYYEKKRGK